MREEKRIYIYILFLLRTSLTKFDSGIKDKFCWKFGLAAFINRLVELVVVLVVGYENANNVRRRTINGLCNFRNHSNGRGYNRHTGTTANGTSLFICKVQLCRWYVSMTAIPPTVAKYKQAGCQQVPFTFTSTHEAALALAGSVSEHKNMRSPVLNMHPRIDANCTA